MVWFRGQVQRRVSRRAVGLSVAIAFFVIGCGSSVAPSDNTGGNVVLDKTTGTARFHVDVATGQVQVTPLTGAASSRAMFTGSAVTFQSSTLLDEPGDNGIRVLNVSLTNRWGVPIGRQPDGTVTGLRVLLQQFANLTAGSIDLRAQTTVSTLPITVSSAAGVACAADGTVYVASQGAHRIYKHRFGTTSVLAGSGSAASADGIGAAASFNAPYGLAVSPVDGALYVAEYSGRRIRRVDANGRVTTVAGSGGSGSVDGSGSAATFVMPLGLAVSPTGTLYVADRGAGTIRSLRLTGADATVASNWTVSTLTSGLNGLWGLCAGTDGNLYVVENAGQRVRLVTTTGASVVIAGTGVAGTADGAGSVAQFSGPTGITQTAAGLVVSESNRLRLVRLAAGASPSDPTAWRVAQLAGASSAGLATGDGTAARFNAPNLLATDAAGNVLVADRGNSTVRRVTLASGLIENGPTGGANSGEQVRLSNASGVYPGASGSTVPYIDYQWYSTPTPPRGRSVLEPGETCPAQPWWFVVPAGVKAFSFVATVEAATPGLVPVGAASAAGSADVVVTTVAGSTNGTAGYLDGTVAGARFSGASAQVDGEGNLFVSETDNRRIRRVDVDGTVTTVAGTSGYQDVDGPGNVAYLGTPGGIALEPAGDVLLVPCASTGVVKRVSLAHGTDPKQAGNWTVTTVASGLYGPVAVVQIRTGTYYVIETTCQRVTLLRFAGGDPDVRANWSLSKFAGTYDEPFFIPEEEIGGSGYWVYPDPGIVDGNSWAARFNSPMPGAVDNEGNLYLVDSGNHNIRRVTADGVVTTLAGSNTAIVPGYTEGARTAARFRQPQGIALDSSGYLYIADTGNNVIRRLSPGGEVRTVAGTGAAGGQDGRGNVATFSGPSSIAVDAGGNLVVCDANGTRIRRIQRVIAAGTQ